VLTAAAIEIAAGLTHPGIPQRYFERPYDDSNQRLQLWTVYSRRFGRMTISAALITLVGDSTVHHHRNIHAIDWIDERLEIVKADFGIILNRNASCTKSSVAASQSRRPAYAPSGYTLLNAMLMRCIQQAG
jgi:hypothetical protein